MGIFDHLQTVFRKSQNLLLPPLCPVSALPVGEVGALHPEGWQKLHFIGPPWCPRCGLPFEIGLTALGGEGILCGACAAPDHYVDALTGPKGLTRLRAVVRYDEASAAMVLALKNGDRLELVPAMANMLGQVGGQMLAEADCVIPVPLHPNRLRARRFNQSAELARRLCALKGERDKYCPLLMQRVRHTDQQKGLNARQRRKNVSGAFRVPATAKPYVRGKNILLIDDVLTTGATIKACAKELKRAGAVEIYGLVFARILINNATTPLMDL